MDPYTHELLRKYGVDALRLAEKNLAEVDLSNRNLAGIDLRGTVITKINLEHADCSGADLRGLQFAMANCVSASFLGADLRAANLAFGYFNAADFRAADLRGARLADSLCNECNFSGADLRGCRLGYDHYNSDFRGADLRGIGIPQDSNFDKLQCDMRGALMTPVKKSNEINMRKSPRILIIPSLTVRDRRSGAEIGRLIDAARQGIRLSSEHPVAIDSVFYLEILLAKECSYGTTIKLDARCVWCKETGEGDTFHAGFKIQKISDEHFEVLKNLIEDQGKRQTEPVENRPDK